MSAFSYTVAPYLRIELEEIEKTRQQVLLTLLSPSESTRLKWESKASSIYFSIRLANLNVRKVSIPSLLSPKNINHLSPEAKLAFAHKNVFNYLYTEWLCTKKLVTAEAIIHLYTLLGGEKNKIDAKILESLLNFIQVNPEHAVIQAGLAHILIIRGLGVSIESERLARFSAYLFLYTYGYDFNCLLDLEEYFFRNPATYNEAIQKNITEENVSSFIEFYVLMFRAQAKQILEKVTHRKYDISFPQGYFVLGERQKKILGLFDEPGVRITNKTVQHRFTVSQITASRDLAKIHSLGLIFSHGKGRSVYYTKE